MAEPDVIDVEAEEIVEENMSVVREPAPSTALVARDEISVEELLKQSAIIEAAMARAMKPDVHYGKIPGVNKPTLLKPGAEKLNVLFRLAPSYQSEKIWHEDGHLTVIAKCILTHIPTGYVVGEGEGLCTTREIKYAQRTQKRTCPTCGAEAIIKGKEEYGGGWICWKKENGCGAKFDDGNPAIESQETGKVANPDLADSYNTVLKMADKRALIAAVLNSTAASDIFTQDVEDGGSSPETPASGSPEPKIEHQKVFDPANELLPGAIKGATAWAQIAQALQAMEPSVDWSDVTAQAVQAIWPAKGNHRDLDPEQTVEFLTRLSNTIARIQQDSGQTEWPNVSDEKIKAGFAWAFAGVQVELTPKVTDAALSADEAAAMAGSEDVEF